MDPNMDIEIRDHRIAPQEQPLDPTADPAEIEAAPSSEPQSMREMLTPKQEAAVLPIGTDYAGEPQSEIEWAPPEYAEPQTPSEVNAGIAEMADPTPDPFVARFGFDAEQASEIFGSMPDGVRPETAEELISALDSAQVTSVEDARRFRDMAVSTYEREQRERERDERLAELEGRLTQMPGSPLDARLSNIESMLTQRQESEREQQYVHQEAARVTDAHVGALGQLIEMARARGIEPPDPAAVERFYSQSGAIRLEPHYAARLAWNELVGPELFGPKPDPRRASITVPAGQVRPQPFHVPIGSSAEAPRTIRDLLNRGE
jgi:hypothetical protein